MTMKSGEHKMLRLFVLIVVFSSSASIAFASNYYLVDRNGNVIDKNDEKYTHVTGLESRSEIQVVSDLDIPVDSAVLKNGVIKKRVKNDMEQFESERAAEEAMVAKRIRKLAIESLAADGVKLKKVEE